MTLLEVMIAVGLLSIVALMILQSGTQAAKQQGVVVSSNVGVMPALGLADDAIQRLRTRFRQTPQQVSLARVQLALAASPSVPIQAGPFNFVRTVPAPTRLSLDPNCPLADASCAELKAAMLRCQATMGVVGAPGAAFRTCFFARLAPLPSGAYPLAFSRSIGGSSANDDVAFAEMTIAIKDLTTFTTVAAAGFAPQEGVTVLTTLYWTRARQAYRRSYMRMLEL